MTKHSQRGGLRLQFRGLSTERGLGPVPYFRIDGHFIRAGPDDKVCARYENHHWDVEGASFASYEVKGDARLHFEDLLGEASRATGPHGDLRFADGVCYAGERMVARLNDETQLWNFFEDDNHWPWLVISAAEKN